MKQVQKILFPIDFAANFESLVPWVETFVEKFGATVYVLFVAQDLSNFSTFFVPHGNIQGFQEEAEGPASKKMAEAAKEPVQGFPKLETRVLVGSPAEKILELAKTEENRSDHHGRPWPQRAGAGLFGSVADKVVAGALCPVMTIHP